MGAQKFKDYIASLIKISYLCRMKYIINNKGFKNKGGIIDYYSKILNSGVVGAPLPQKDFGMVNELLKYHSGYVEKVGCGIDSISIEFHFDNLTNRRAKYPHFQLNRVDNTNIDISYRKAVRDINKTTTLVSEKRKDVKRSMRFIIKEQINEFRDLSFTSKQYLKCPILGINFSKKTCHVDHAPPMMFDRLVFNFLNETNINIDEVEVEDINGIFSTLKDKNLREKWFNYHKNNAQLRVTHKAGNLSQKREKLNWD